MFVCFATVCVHLLPFLYVLVFFFGTVKDKPCFP